VVKLRFHAGLPIEQVAKALGLSRTTAYRHWAYARPAACRQAEPSAPRAAGTLQRYSPLVLVTRCNQMSPHIMADSNCTNEGTLLMPMETT
jgi:hypothetical protein